MKSRRALAGGTVHAVPADFREVIAADPGALGAWEDITPLARNEWLCWVESAKKAETRRRRIARARAALGEEGKRRPCCWPGCPHR